MVWKTRGQVRREAQGEKKVKCYLEFTLTGEDHSDGTLHQVSDCESIDTNMDGGRFTIVRLISVWETELSKPHTFNQKIGRGAWVRVTCSALCPLCFENEQQ